MQSSHLPPRVIVIMGVAGSGKTTVGIKLARELGWDFYDGDEFHPEEDVAKMSRGMPLTDADRWPWLDRLHTLILDSLENDRPAVVTCSALKKAYRERLLRDTWRTALIYLRGDFDLIYGRLQARSDHFMKAGMLQSQFDVLEEPQEAITVGIDADSDVIVDQIIRRLKD